MNNKKSPWQFAWGFFVGVAAKMIVMPPPISAVFP